MNENFMQNRPNQFGFQTVHMQVYYSDTQKKKEKIKKNQRTLLYYYFVKKSIRRIKTTYPTSGTVASLLPKIKNEQTKNGRSRILSHSHSLFLSFSDSRRMKNKTVRREFRDATRDTVARKDFEKQ